eukprot:scaffold54032_cov24-Phaeocystis_antarctica.AAC.1
MPAGDRRPLASLVRPRPVAGAQKVARLRRVAGRRGRRPVHLVRARVRARARARARVSVRVK